MFRASILIVSLAFSIHAETIQLSQDGRSLVSVVAAEESLKPAAQELAAMLQRITGADFTQAGKDTPHGIHLSLSPAAAAITQREQYSIRSRKDRLDIIGHSPQAVEHAIWDLLHRIGSSFLARPGRLCRTCPP
jgi:hypothetical protein